MRYSLRIPRIPFVNRLCVCGLLLAASALSRCQAQDMASTTLPARLGSSRYVCRFQDKTGNGQATPFSGEARKLKDQTWGLVLAHRQPIMAIPVSAGGLSPVQRAHAIAARLNKLYRSGVRFREPGNYLVGQLNGQIVLAMRVEQSSNTSATRSRQEEEKVHLLFTIDSHLVQYLTNKEKKQPTCADIAFFWRDVMIKILTEDTDIATPIGEEQKDKWADVPAGYSEGKVAVVLRASQVLPAHN